MSDIQFKLYDVDEGETLNVLEADYELLAKLSNHGLTKRLVEAFEPRLRDSRLALSIIEDREVVARRSWVPLSTGDDQMEHQLEINCDMLLKDYRDNQTIVGEKL